MKEFNQILKDRGPFIKKSLIEPSNINSEKQSNTPSKNEPKSE